MPCLRLFAFCQFEVKSTMDMKYIVIVQMDNGHGDLFISFASLWIGWTRITSDCDDICFPSACGLDGPECQVVVIKSVFCQLVD